MLHRETREFPSHRIMKIAMKISLVNSTTKNLFRHLSRRSNFYLSQGIASSSKTFATSYNRRLFINNNNNSPIIIDLPGGYLCIESSIRNALLKDVEGPLPGQPEDKAPDAPDTSALCNMTSRSSKLNLIHPIIWNIFLLSNYYFPLN